MDKAVPEPLKKIILVMLGVKLDESPNSDLTKEPLLTSDTEFSDSDPTPVSGNADPRNIAHLQMRRSFIKSFKSVNREIIHGVYIKLRSSDNEWDIIKVLDQLSAEGSDTVHISFGFYSQVENPDHNVPNCLHLVFRGNIPGSTFSTWDGEGYQGPKPSCPPFGCNSFTTTD